MDKKFINKTDKPVKVEIIGKLYSIFRVVYPGGYIFTRPQAKIKGEGLTKVTLLGK